MIRTRAQLKERRKRDKEEREQKRREKKRQSEILHIEQIEDLKDKLHKHMIEIRKLFGLQVVGDDED